MYYSGIHIKTPLISNKYNTFSTQYAEVGNILLFSITFLNLPITIYYIICRSLVFIKNIHTFISFEI